MMRLVFYSSVWLRDMRKMFMNSAEYMADTVKACLSFFCNPRVSVFWGAHKQFLSTC